MNLQKATQEFLVKQLNNLISQKLVMKLPSYGEQRLPLLKDVYYSLFENETINLLDVLDAPEGSYSDNIRKDFEDYYDRKTGEIYDSFLVSNVTLNDKLERYYTYILDALVKDRILNKDYRLSSGYLDYDNGNISIMGFLNYCIKEDYIDPGKEFERRDIDSRGWTDQAIYTFLIDEIISYEYFNRYQFRNSLFWR